MEYGSTYLFKSRNGNWFVVSRDAAAKIIRRKRQGKTVFGTLYRI